TDAPGTYYYAVSVLDPNNGCDQPTSEGVTVVVRPDATISAVVNNPEVCTGGNATLTATLTNGSSSATVQWQKADSPTGSWTDIAGETNMTYAAATTVADTFYYRVVVVDPVSGCAVPESDMITVVVRDQATIAASIDNDEICVGGVAILSAVLSNGSSAEKLQWQISTGTGGTWTDIPNATNAARQAPAGGAGTFSFPVVVTDPTSGCDDPTSNIVTLETLQGAQVEASVDNAEVCIGG